MRLFQSMLFVQRFTYPALHPFLESFVGKVYFKAHYTCMFLCHVFHESKIKKHVNASINKAMEIDLSLFGP